MKADLVLKNGVIYKADSARTIAEALAVADGKIIYVGDNNGVNEYITETTEIVDLQGKLVLPSFFEGHTHYTKATATVVGINLAGMNTEAEYVESCRNFIAARPGIKLLRGQGYLVARSRRSLIGNSVLFLVFFLSFVIRTLLADGYAVNPETGEVFMEPYKYLTNFIEMPLVLVLFLIGVVLVLFGIGKSLLKTKFDKGIWFTGIGTVLAVLALLLVAGYNNTAYYPSTNDLQSSLTLANSCSSQFTLRVMFYVSFLVPFVLAYIFYAWRSIDIHKISEKEMKDGGHAY